MAVPVNQPLIYQGGKGSVFAKKNGVATAAKSELYGK